MPHCKSIKLSRRSQIGHFDHSGDPSVNRVS